MTANVKPVVQRSVVVKTSTSGVAANPRGMVLGKCGGHRKTPTLRIRIALPRANEIGRGRRAETAQYACVAAACQNMKNVTRHAPNSTAAAQTIRSCTQQTKATTVQNSVRGMVRIEAQAEGTLNGRRARSVGAIQLGMYSSATKRQRTASPQTRTWVNEKG